MFQCEYCKKELSTKSSLTLHQKTAKYCLEIQGKNIKQFECNNCNEKFTTKPNLDRHVSNCKKRKENKIITLENENKDLKNENEDLKNENIMFKKQVEMLENLLKEKDQMLERIASRPTISHTDNSNNIQVTFEIDKSQIENNLTKYDDNYMIDGLKGVAEFMAKEVFPKEHGKYLCTDKARNTFKYKDEEGKTFKDPNCTKLIEISQPIIKNKLIDTYREYEQQIKDYKPTEEDKKAILTGKAQLTFKKDKVLETKLEVVDMHKNNKFANHLSNYLTI
jgi:hypothetical protein